MGEPVHPTPEERARTRAYARDVVESVRNDEDQPRMTHPDGDAMSDELVIFLLSQEILLLHAGR